MRLYCSLLLCCVILFAYCTSIGAVEKPFNYVPNPEFVGVGDAIVEWSNHIASGKCEFSLAKGRGPDGANAAVITGLGADSVGRWYADASILAGATYEFRIMVRTGGDVSGCIITGLNDPQFYTSPDKWTQQTIRFKTPTGRMSVRFHLQQYGKGTIEYSKPEFIMLKLPAPETDTAPVPAAGGEITAIVTPESPNPVEIGCALEVRRIFLALTGKNISITTKTSPGRCLYIGTTPEETNYKHRLARLQEDGIILDINKKFIVCTGATPSGVYNAVVELYYRIGCRWIWPGQYGECLPDKGPIPLPKSLKLTYNPPYILRGGTMCQVEVDAPNAVRGVDVGQWTDWAAKNHYNRAKSCYCTTWNYGAERAYGWEEVSGHTTTEFLLPSTEFEAHPEWFALYKGNRVGTHQIGTTAMPCISNKELQARFIKIALDYLETHPRAKRYFVGANDEPSYWCECGNCKALDPPGTDMSKNGIDSMEMTDRWLYLVNLVAAEVAKKYPGKWVGTFAYGSSRSIPKRVKPLPNVMIEYTLWDRCYKHSFMDRKCPVNACGASMIRKWKKIATAVSIYGYLDHIYPGIPEPYWMSDRGLYNDLSKLGVRYVSDEVDTVPSVSPLLMGYRTRLLWDLSEDPISYLKTFCKTAYGRAAIDMEAFWNLQWDTVMNSPTPHPVVCDLVRYNPDMVAKSYKILDIAASKADTDDIRARIARARMSIDMVRLYMTKAKKDDETSKWNEFMDIRSTILDTSKKWNLPVDYFAYQSLGSGYIMPTEALNGRNLVDLPEEWLFRTDPDSKGESEKWYEPSADLSAFKPISVLKTWEPQGYDAYDGLAWYVTDIVIPETREKRVWLLFGAVDDSWTLWIDGQYITKSTADPGIVWDKPAAADITGKYTSGKKTRIAVRVGDILAAGGIWKPVKIMASD